MPEVRPFKLSQTRSPQSETSILPKLPVRAIVAGPSNSGKGVLMTNLLTRPEFWGNSFARIYYFSPSSSVDTSLDPLREHVSKFQDQSTDPTFFDTFEPEQIKKILDRAQAVTEALKTKGSNQRHNIMIVIDDFADSPQVVHKCGGILETLFIRARHFHVSTVLSTQKFRAVSPCIRINATAMFVFR